MRKTLTRSLALFLTLQPALALAQSPPNIAAQHLWGRLGIPGDVGPSQQIPFATLGISTNAVNMQTSNYAVAPGDCGGLIQAGAGSTGKFTVTLPSTSGFPAACAVTVINGDTGRGKIMSGFPAGVPSPLAPLQSVKVQIINGAWTATARPGRWRLPGATTIYVDSTGSNTLNDGLAPGSTGAFATIAGAMTYILGAVDLNSQTLTLQNASGQNLADLTFSGQFTGSGKFVFDGGGATINANANAAAIYVSMPVTGQVSVSGTAGTPSNLFLIQNMTITCNSGNHNGLLVSAGYVSLNGGSGAGGNITFGSCGAAQIVGDGSGSRIFNLGNYTINGGAANHLQQTAGGLIDFNNNGNTVTLSGTPAFTQFAFAEFGGGCMVIQNAWTGAATGAQYLASGNGCILNTTGSALPGSVAGTTSTGGFYYPFSKTAYSVYSANSAGTSADFGSIDLSQSGTVGSSVLGTANGGTGLAALAAGIASWFATPNSANLRAALTDETGTGPAVFGTSPNITTPTGIVANDVGLGNVNNTSDATKNAATATLTNKTLTAPILTKGIFSTLTACASGIEGMMAAVTDSSTAVWGATITGSSTNHVLAYCDGTNWTVAGK